MFYQEVLRGWVDVMQVRSNEGFPDGTQVRILPENAYFSNIILSNIQADRFKKINILFNK